MTNGRRMNRDERTQDEDEEKKKKKKRKNGSVRG